MCCACPVTSALDNPFNALPADWASDPELLAGLRVDDDDEHDDPVLRWPDGRVVDTFREDYELYHEDGVIHLDYGGGCAKCGLQVSWKDTKLFYVEPTRP